jgi:hypothetical protein
MGYTHYWRFHKDKMETETLRKTFALVSDECKKVLQHLRHRGKLCGGLGEGEPIFNESEIWFNGDGEKGLDHETFCITWKGKEGFDFCKTARKPYDLAVCFCLLSFHKHFPSDVFTLSSDGSAEDWQEAVDLYNKTTDNQLENPFQ